VSFRIYNGHYLTDLKTECNIKDTEKTNIGHIKDNMEQEIQVQQNIVANNKDIFDIGLNKSFIHIFKKTERLVSAIYLVTNFFSDNEPIKWSLRKKSEELLSFVLAYRNTNQSANSVFVENGKTKIIELISLLEVSMNAGLVSNMNFSVVNKEFINLIGLLNQVNFKTENDSVTDALNKSFATSFSGLSIKDKVFVSNTSLPQVIKDNNSVLEGRIEFKKTNRQNIIVNLLKKRKELTIKDIASVIKDCSEKTIQRELISFINAGLLKRTGERRWSKYSLV
jgi:hypothetical protein